MILQIEKQTLDKVGYEQTIKHLKHIKHHLENLSVDASEVNELIKTLEKEWNDDFWSGWNYYKND